MSLPPIMQTFCLILLSFLILSIIVALSPTDNAERRAARERVETAKREAIKRKELSVYRTALNATLANTGYTYPLFRKSSGDQPTWLAFRIPSNALLPRQEDKLSEVFTRLRWKADPFAPPHEVLTVVAGPVVTFALTPEETADHILSIDDDGRIQGRSKPDGRPIAVQVRTYYTGVPMNWTPDCVNLVLQSAIQRLAVDLDAESRKREADRTAEFIRRNEAERSAAIAKKAAEERAVLEALREEAWVVNPQRLADLISRHQTAPRFLADAIEKQYRELLAYQADRHMRLDAHGLSGDARYLFLPSVINLTANGRYPAFDFARSRLEPRALVYVNAHAALDLDAWLRSSEQINRYLGGQWIMEALDGTSVKLTKRPELPELIPFDHRYLRKGEVFMGINTADGEPYYVPLAKLTHVLVGGQSGSGKSVMLNQVMRSLLFNLDQIDDLLLVDLKRVELARYRNLSPKIRLITQYGDLIPLIQSLVDDMNARYAEMDDRGEVTKRSNYRFLIIDEFASIQQRPLTSQDEKKQHAALIAKLNQLSQLARAAGIKIWAQLQKPTADNMDSSFRTNLQSIASFFMPAKINASAMFGELDGLPADPTKLRKGEYVFRDDSRGETVLLKSTYCDETDIDGLRAALSGSTRAS